MALLAEVPWTDMDDTRVATDAPVSTDLMTDMNVNLNYLKAVLTDGASAPQGIIGDDITAFGDLDVKQDGNVDGDFHIGGTLSGGGVGIDDTVSMAALNLASQ